MHYLTDSLFHPDRSQGLRQHGRESAAFTRLRRRRCAHLHASRPPPHHIRDPDVPEGSNPWLTIVKKRAPPPGATCLKGDPRAVLRRTAVRARWAWGVRAGVWGG